MARGRTYGVGDEWGCVSRRYAAGADEYIAAIRQYLAARTRREPDFVVK